MVVAKRQRLVGAKLWGYAKRACGKFDRHRWHRLSIHQKSERNPSYHVIGVAVDIERANIALLKNNVAVAAEIAKALAALDLPAA